MSKVGFLFSLASLPHMIVHQQGQRKGFLNHLVRLLQQYYTGSRYRLSPYGLTLLHVYS